MKYRILILLFLLGSILISPQNISRLNIISSKGKTSVPVYMRQGTVYFSVKHFADSLLLKYLYNSQSKKIELKFANHNLRVVADNPYLVITGEENKTESSYQLPTTAYLRQDHIYIPLAYSLEALKKASGYDIKFENPDRLVINEKVIPKGINKEEMSAKKFDIPGILLEEKANGVLIRINSNKRIPAYNSSYKDGILTVVFRKVNADVNKIESIGGRGLIKEIKVKNIKDDTEFKFIVGKEYNSSEVLNAEGSSDILITIHNKIFSSNEREKNKAKWNFDVVVIDAGHGGKDPGTIGINGVKEKDINLAIALKLGELIEKNMNEVKVVYTRKKDTFIELFKRGKIANDNNGKLFISIHCNSTPKKPTDAKGFEVYLLRPGRTQEAISIAERENSVIQYEDNPERYEKLTDENFILVSMAHSSYMKYSEKFSELLDKEISNDIEMESRGVKQAGFFVLVGASMPSVLIESGFLSNKEDAEYLKGKKGQQNIAESIFDSLKKFKEHYDKIMETEL